MTHLSDNVTPLRPGAPPGAPTAPLAAVQGTLALDLGPELAPPSVAEAPVLRGADTVLVHPRVRREAHRWAMTFTQACVEVVLGVRPASQLVRWTTPEIHRELAYRAGVVARAGVHGGSHGRRPPVRPQVENVRTCFVTEDTVEMCVRVRHGQRSRAIAGRLEHVRGRWQCTALEFG